LDITKKLQKTRIKKNIQNTRTHPHEMAGRPNTPAARGAEWLHRTSANIEPRFASIRVDRSLQVKLGL